MSNFPHFTRKGEGAAGTLERKGATGLGRLLGHHCLLSLVAAWWGSLDRA